MAKTVLVSENWVGTRRFKKEVSVVVAEERNYSKTGASGFVFYYTSGMGLELFS